MCINRLAEEFNTEESIRTFYRLDAQNRLPAQVVTDDEDEADDSATTVSHDNGDVTNKNSGTQRQYSEQDLSYLSSLRIKPNKLSKTQSAMFDAKLKENTAPSSHGSRRNSNSSSISGLNNDDITDASSSVAVRKVGAGGGRSLNSVVARLTATRKQGGDGVDHNIPHHQSSSSSSQLLDQYKRSKGITVNNKDSNSYRTGKNDPKRFNCVHVCPGKKAKQSTYVDCKP